MHYPKFIFIPLDALILNYANFKTCNEHSNFILLSVIFGKLKCCV